MGEAFRPPRNNPFCEALVRATLPFLCKTVFKGLKIEIDPADIERLKQHKGQRMLLLPNHPAYDDPVIMFELSRRLGESFNYVAAREVFDFNRGLRGMIFQNCGVYSVIRGTSDRESFRTTREILYTGRRRLVIFIEGEVSYDNDVLIPFQQGVLQLAFRSQEDLAKDAAKAGHPEDFPPLYVVPVAMKYFYADGMEPVLDHATADLEKAVGLEPQPGKPLYPRLHAVGEKVISVQENLLGLEPAGTLEERINAVREKLLRKMETFLELQPPDPAETLARIRVIRNQMDRIIHTYADTSKHPLYEKHVQKRLSRTFKEFYEDLDRVVNIMTWEEGAVLERDTPEKYAELIRRVEKEVFGERRLIHPRTAVVKIGEIINLKDHYPAYLDDRKQAASNLCTALETDMLTMLNLSKKERLPV